MSTSTEQRVRRVVGEFGGLSVDISRLSDTADLFAAGMTSHASVSVLLGLENEFELEFPDHMLSRSVFESVAAIRKAVSELEALMQTGG